MTGPDKNEPAASPADLSDARRRIDAIDREIVELFERRMHIVEDVAAYKQATGKAVYDREREAEKIAAALEYAEDEFKQFIPPLFGLIMEMSRACQHRLLQDGPAAPLPEAVPEASAALPDAARVACQGVQGAYSHIAAKALFSQVDVVFCDTWASVCDRVEDGSAAFGVLPLENSTAGTVARVYDLLSERGLFIAASLTLRIEHDLLAKPGCRLEDVREVVSHEQALRQCEGFIASLAGARATACENTAMAARTVAESPRSDLAAVASSECARLWGLVPLARSVQDESDNYTRFVCVSRALRRAPDADRSSFLLVLPHEPGSLYRVLARIAALGVNLLKLESRPIPGRCFDFMFYVDIACVPGTAPFDDIVAQVSLLCERFCYLGSYREYSR